MASALLVTACDDDDDFVNDIPPTQGDGSDGSAAPRTPLVPYRATTLVTNVTDPSLVNPWGLVPKNGLFWIADEATGVVSVYDAGGRTSPDHPTGRYNLGAGITGVARVDVASDSGLFLLPCDGSTQMQPADLVFASEEGKLIALNNMSPTNGVTVVDREAQNAHYLGVAFLNIPSGAVLLAADFPNGRIDMFDSNFNLLVSGAFADTQMPAGWGPFNVVVTNNHVYVMEAKIGPDGEEERGDGLGAVAIFDTNGTMITRVTSPNFNAPWGLAVAPGSSGLTVGVQTMFVGNFGDGRITAFETSTGKQLGQLTDDNGNVMVLDGLWGLVIGDANGGSPNALYFAAGPADETAGVYGRIERVNQDTGIVY